MMHGKSLDSSPCFLLIHEPTSWWCIMFPYKPSKGLCLHRRGVDNQWDDGTLAPTAAGGSIAFAPELVVPTLLHFKELYGDLLLAPQSFCLLLLLRLKAPASEKGDLWD